MKQLVVVQISHFFNQVEDTCLKNVIECPGPRRVRLVEKPTTLKRTIRQNRPPKYPPPYRSRDYCDFDSDEEVTIPLTARQQKEGSMCTSGSQQQNSDDIGEAAKRLCGGELLSEDVKVINNLIEDLSRLDPSESSRSRSVRAFNRFDPNYTMETEFHSSGSITGAGNRSGGHGGSSGNGKSKRRTSIVSNASKTSRQVFTTATTTVPPIVEKQPGITEQVKYQNMKHKITFCQLV